MLKDFVIGGVLLWKEWRLWKGVNKTRRELVSSCATAWEYLSNSPYAFPLHPIVINLDRAPFPISNARDPGPGVDVCTHSI